MISIQTSNGRWTARFVSQLAFRPALNLLLLALLSTCPLMEGCNSASSGPSPAGILLSKEPDGARTVLEVREALLGPADTEHPHAGHTHTGQDHVDHEHLAPDTHHDANQAQATNHADTPNGPKEGDSKANHRHAEQAADHDTGPTDEHHQTDAPLPKTIKPVGPAGPIEVVIVGQIGGLTNPWQQTEPDFPFVKGQTKFFLADPEAVAEHQGAGHHHAPGEECAFCAAHAHDNSALLAVVQFKNKQGRIVPRDARRWFAFQGNETVVVHGQARIVAGGLLVVDADHLYVRR